MRSQENSERFGDAHLERSFAALNSDLGDADFTASVMRQVRKSQLRRAIRTGVIAAAAAGGVAMAFDPMADLLATVRSTVAWDAVGWLEMYRLPALAAAVCLVAWPALAKWVAR